MMDFTPELSAMQGMLTSLNDDFPFPKLKTKGGNNEEVQSLITKVHKFLKEKEYIEEDGTEIRNTVEMRKFALLLVMNTDFHILREMLECKGTHVIGTVPTLTKYLTFEIFTNCKMDTFLFELIVFTEPHFGIEIAKSFVYFIKYLKPPESFDKLKLISSAIYTLLCRLHFLNVDKNDLPSLLTNAYNAFQKCNNYFNNLPNKENLRPAALKMLQAHSTLSILTLTNECLVQFSSMPKFKTPGFDDIYLLTYTNDHIDEVDFKISASPNTSILQCLHKCNKILADVCCEILEPVNADDFCYWAELEMNEKTMQQSIREISTCLCRQIKMIPTLAEHQLISMLQQFSDPAKNYYEIINSMDTQSIIESIDAHDSEYSEWVQALLRKYDLCKDISLIECLVKNISVFEDEEIKDIFKMIVQSIKNSTTEEENDDVINRMKLCACIAFEKCKKETMWKLLLEEHFSNECFNNQLESTELGNTITEVFNKLIVKDNVDLTVILIPFLQSPQKLYTKVFEMATENNKQISIMFKIIEFLRPFTNYTYGNDENTCIMNTLRDRIKQLNTATEQNHFVTFLCLLKKSEIIPESILLHDVIMPELRKHLPSRNIREVGFQMMLMQRAYTSHELVKFRAPLLVILGQVLDVLRWSITTFCHEKAVALETTIKIQRSLIETYKDGNMDIEFAWLRTKLTRRHIINVRYYNPVWKHPECNLLEHICGESINRDTDTSKIISHLWTVLVSCTLTEWCEIWKNLTVLGEDEALNVLNRCLLLVILLECKYGSQSTWDCVLHSYGNFVHIIRYNYLKEPLSNDKVSVVLCTLNTSVYALSEKNHLEDFGTTLLPLFSYLMQRKDDYKIDMSSFIKKQNWPVKFATPINQIIPWEQYTFFWMKSSVRPKINFWPKPIPINRLSPQSSAKAEALKALRNFVHDFNIEGL